MKASLDGVRVHVIVPKRKKKFLDDYSRKTGISVSEHLRRALDQYILSLAEQKSRG